VLLIVEAESEAELRRRPAADPWTRAGLLVIVGVEEWNVIVGGERLASHPVETSSGARSPRDRRSATAIRIVEPRIQGEDHHSPGPASANLT
jgi:hypothetical protein